VIRRVVVLPKVTLGRTGLEVTRLGFGALELRDVREAGGRLPSEEHAGVVLRAVLDAGINFIDTSAVYGRSEEFIGRFIAARRDEYYLATKCGGTQTDGPGVRSAWTRAAMLESIDLSLRRLRTDYVDVLQLRGPTVEVVERYDCIGTLEEIRAAGKARFIGVSAVLPHVGGLIALGAFDTFQIVYSALEPEHEPTITAAAAVGAGTIVRGGSVKGAPLREQGRGGEFPTVRSRWLRSGLADVLEGRDIVETMFRYALAHPSAHTFINGTQDLDHLRANIRAVELGPLESDLQSIIRERVMAAVESE
jgi:aryl-alcohol dehydrogenase-like predicted oxidoreductase